MPKQASGTFDVTLTHQAAECDVGRAHLSKTFHGDLQGGSQGQMLMTQAEEGSAGYVALEVADVTLDGRSGTFKLLHRGVMNRGIGTLDVSVVPDSATGALRGLSGSMTIDIAADGTHHYVLEYTLPE